MFTLFWYGLIPVVLYCAVVIAASFDTYSTNAVRESSWPQTVATVIKSQDVGEALPEFNGAPNAFPDPYGTLNLARAGPRR